MKWRRSRPYEGCWDGTVLVPRGASSRRGMGAVRWGQRTTNASCCGTILLSSHMMMYVLSLVFVLFCPLNGGYVLLSPGANKNYYSCRRDDYSNSSSPVSYYTLYVRTSRRNNLAGGLEFEWGAMVYTEG
jgi:hypothetical protein